MRISLSLFSQFCLLLVLGLTIVFFKSENLLDRQAWLADMPKDRTEELESKDFELRVVRAQMDEVKAEALALLEKEGHLPANSIALQNLRSHLRSPASIPRLDMSLLDVEKIKNAFREKEYFRVTELAEEFVSKNPQSSLIPEVSFFASESYFLNRQYDKAINTIEKMTSLYPDHIMTGYALLRLGQISEKADQSMEAISIYKIIQSQFNDKNLSGEATLRISRIEQ